MMRSWGEKKVLGFISKCLVPTSIFKYVLLKSIIAQKLRSSRDQTSSYSITIVKELGKIIVFNLCCSCDRIDIPPIMFSIKNILMD
ncbi:hypothetical protein AHAS_Ahas19G0267800 [Arachis hypogaea]